MLSDVELSISFLRDFLYDRLKFNSLVHLTSKDLATIEWRVTLVCYFRDREDVSFDDSLPIERRGSLTSMISMTTTMTTDSSSSGGGDNRVSQGTVTPTHTYVCQYTGST